jgi:predicted transposase YdaD
MELIETIVVYKFPSLSREEIEKMLGLSELRQTKVYQEALEEGREEGIVMGEQRGEQSGAVKEARSLILRQLARRVGTIPATLETQVQALDLPRLETLSEALLDFSEVEDLTQWLQGNS